LVALLLVTVSLPWFNQLADKQMVMFWLNPLFWAISLAFIVVTSLVAGSYPAFYLSSFNPVHVLKGTFQAGRFAALPRKVLVVVQFTVSISLIIGTIIVFRQIEFAKNRPVGYDRNGLLMLPIKSPDVTKKLGVLHNELKVQVLPQKSLLLQVLLQVSGPKAAPLTGRIKIRIKQRVSALTGSLLIMAKPLVGSLRQVAIFQKRLQQIQ
jgi:hypothetical protein